MSKVVLWIHIFKYSFAHSFSTVLLSAAYELGTEETKMAKNLSLGVYSPAQGVGKTIIGGWE